MSGRFAPSPSGELHLGNLRTAVVAWLSARSGGARFLMRIEDLDPERSRPEHERSQLRDLAAIGIDWDGDVVRQSERQDRYDAAIQQLDEAELVYDCFCTRREIRREIRGAPNAPHLPPGSYPGTCRDLSEARRAEHRAAGREPALRLRSDAVIVDFEDRLAGPTSGSVDDFVLRRNDGAPAYNLAVVVDDAEQGVTEVIRGDDLLDSTPRQIALQRLLGYATPAYLHVPLVLSPSGDRLSKRHGAITLGALGSAGVSREQVVGWIIGSLDLNVAGGSTDLVDVVERFDATRIPRQPVTMPDLA